MPYICTHEQRLSTFAACVSRGAKPYTTHLWYATRDRTGTATCPREIRVAIDLGIRGRTLSSAIASLLQRAAGQHVLTWACRADELPGKGSQTEGGEAPALIHTVFLVSLESSFLPHLLQRLVEGSAR